MDWTLALKRNQDILLRNVAWLFTWLNLEVGGSVETLPRIKQRTILFVLRPSESAYRRLIFVAVFVLGTKAPVLLERMTGSGGSARKAQTGRKARTTPPPFKLIDPRKNFDLFPNKPKYAKGPGPRVTDLWSDDPIYDRSDLYADQERRARAKEESLSAKSLCNRMNALMAALEDLPGQAQRMASLQARMARRSKRTGKPNLSLLRPGLPPGFRQRQKHEVDEVLAECHWLARSAPIDFKPPEPG